MLHEFDKIARARSSKRTKRNWNGTKRMCLKLVKNNTGATSYLQSVYGVFNCSCVQKNCCLILLLADNCIHHNAKSNGRLRITCEQIDVTSKLQTLKNMRKSDVKVNQMSIFPHHVSCAISAKFHCIWWMFPVHSYEFFYAFVFDCLYIHILYARMCHFFALRTICCALVIANWINLLFFPCLLSSAIKRKYVLCHDFNLS